MNNIPKSGLAGLWLSIFFGVLVWSYIDPADRLTWWLEVLPALLGLVILASTFKRFPLAPMLYWLILTHAIILMVGGHYTYAEVPLFDWIRDQTGGTRNDFDKLGHFAQGFVPAMIARELLLRLTPLVWGGWCAFLVVSVCLAISAFYEMIEWWVALLSDQAAEAFLGTQGYVWDTQSDMFFALIGAICALLLLSRAHDRQLSKLSHPGKRTGACK